MANATETTGRKTVCDFTIETSIESPTLRMVAKMLTEKILMQVIPLVAREVHNCFEGLEEVMNETGKENAETSQNGGEA